MNVADAMTPRESVEVAELPGTRDDVLELLQEREFSSVPVVKVDGGEERFRGLVSREDLIERPDEDQLALLMRKVPTTSSDTSLEALATLMIEEATRRVPVVDGELEGIITITDLIRAIADGAVDVDATVDEVATLDVNTTFCDVPLRAAAQELYYANVPYSVIIDEEGDMSGILTEVDIIEVAEVVEGEDSTGDSIADEDDDWMWEGIKAVGGRYLPTRNVEMPDGPVSEYMSSDLVTVGKTRTVQEAAQTLISNDVEQVPLVSGGRLVGIVRDIDLLRAVR
ncbi:MAG: CBS domain-containing protein [Halobacteriales archaeon]|nr:CBS domain-containing protein [Halobacteriales archaeon]